MSAILLTQSTSINANVYKLVFWIISRLLFEPKLKEEIVAEIEPAFRGESNSAPDLDYLLYSCPLLASTCEEVLRLTIWSIGTRSVLSDTAIGGKKLRQGRKLIMPYRAMHYCPGRYVARREVQMVTAVILKRFDMSLQEGDSKGQMSAFPKMDDTLPSGGIQAPLRGEDLIIRIKPSK